MFSTYKGLLIVRNYRKKYGVFDKNLKIIVPFEYDELYSIDTLDDGFLFAYKNGQSGILNIKTGEFKVDETLLNETDEINPFNPIKEKGDKYGLTDENGNFTILPIYDAIEPWIHNITYFQAYDDNTYPEIPQRYLIYKDNKIGVASQIKVCTPPIYDDIITDEYMTQQRPYPAFVGEKDGSYGYIDNDGNPLSEFIYNEIDFPCISSIGHGFRADNGCMEFISLKTKKVIYTDTNKECEHTSTMHNHLTMLTKNGKYKVYDEYGTLLTEFDDNDKLKSTGIIYLNDKVLQYGYFFSKKESDRYGLVDYSGNIITDAVYRDITPYNDADVLLCECIFGRKFEILDSNGKVLVTNIYGAGGSAYNEDGSSSLPIMYWKDEELVRDIYYYPEIELTEEDKYRYAIWDRFEDIKNKCVVFDNGEPYVYASENNEIIVYDEFRNILKKINFKVAFWDEDDEILDFDDDLI